MKDLPADPAERRRAFIANKVERAEQSEHSAEAGSDTAFPDARALCGSFFRRR